MNASCKRDKILVHIQVLHKEIVLSTIWLREWVSVHHMVNQATCLGPILVVSIVDNYCFVSLRYSSSWYLHHHLMSFPFLFLGSEMCAICPSAAKRQSLGGRCKGHGVDSELTRWRSTVKPKCHGKWRRLYQVGDCPCKTGADFIFV